MIRCRSCKHEAYDGTLFCSECGARLAGPALKTGVLPEGMRLGVEVAGCGVVLPQPAKTEYSIGRSEKGQAIVPDVDLAPYGATDAGVSRVHAILRVEQESLFVLDYQSTNGSHLNGFRLEPHVPHPVQHGDELSLGTLRVRIHWRA